MKIHLQILVLLFFISCAKKNEKFNYVLKKTNPLNTGVDFKNIVREDVEHNIIKYIYHYNGGGVSVGDINNDNLPDLFFVSNQNENKLYINKGKLKFEDITAKANIKSNATWNTGATMIDINNDGFLDIYLCSVSGLLDFKGRNELYINNGNGTFTESAKEYGLDFKGYSTQSYFFDYDKDGDLDVYIVNHAVHTTSSHGNANIRSVRDSKVGDVLLKNDNGKFIDVSEKANIYGGINGYGLSASIADFNNDGWEDIYVCNDFHEDDYYYINNRDGTFKESHESAFSIMSRFSMGSDAGDVNNDGYQDLITLDMLPKDERALKESEGDDTMLNVINILRKLGYKDQYSRNMLQINNKGKYFYENALYNDIADTDWSWSPLIADFNNDGHQDVFITNGILRRPNDLDFRQYVSNKYKFRNPNLSKDEWLFQSLKEIPSGKISNKIFSGNSKRFKNETGKWIEDVASLSNGAAYSDLDLDGDLDLVVNNFNDVASIYENDTKLKNYLNIKLNYTKNNKNGIGTKVYIFTKNKKQFKQLFNSRGFYSSTDNKLHFGLDTIKKIDSIKIIWPNNKNQTIKKISPNNNITINYKENTVTNELFTQKEKPIFKKTKLIPYKHSEDSYEDYLFEKIIPYRISMSGPAIAIKDIDKNGYEDIFLGNASGKKASLYLNNGTKFIKKDIPNLSKDSIYEDITATFIDIDNDNDFDLYIGSGISTQKNNKYLKDRLYINIDNNFILSEGKIPDNTNNTSIVISNDYDNDGDMDLFIGNRSHSKSFGQTVYSYILKNDGKGNFSKDKNFNLSTIVTDAKWEDINNDNIKDLIITTEWDFPKIYINKNGQLNLVKTMPENLNGLWQTSTLYDIDNDGDKDLLLGNFGLNTKFKNPTKKEPLLMYYSDFDNNGKKETVLASYKQNTLYPINSKNELATQMNYISKKFVKYKNFATKDVHNVIGEKVIEKAKKYVVNNLASGYLENNKGEFKVFKKFPPLLQLAPINSFCNITIDNKKKLFITGNTKTVNTYHGEYSSLKGIVLESINNYYFADKLGIDKINNQVKEAYTIDMKNKTILIIVLNNDSLKSYTLNK